MSNHVLAFLLTLTLSSFTSCQSKKQTDSPLNKVHTGMSYIDVLEQAGIPDTVIHLGSMLDEYGSQTKTDEWWYGSNQVIVMVNDTVNAIDPDAEATQKRIRKIIDSAQAEDGL